MPPAANHTMTTYTPPALESDAFHCPHCGVYAHQRWSVLCDFITGEPRQVKNFNVGQCVRCKQTTIWNGDQMVYPLRGTAPLPNFDMPEEVRKVYEEANQISNLSPRGAAALLRLAVEMLCKQLAQSGGDLNADIAVLVKKGLLPMVQQALDSVRVIGNEAVHPGTIDLRDNAEIVAKLFGLLNIIVENQISHPKHAVAIYGLVPEAKRKAIDKRDGK
jgi:hypothetical protein